MTRYRTQDGTTFEADTPLSLVKQMRKTSFTPSFDILNFCTQMSGRAEVASGAAIRIVPVEAFVEDLLQAGIVRVVAEDDAASGDKQEGEGEDLRDEQERNYQRDLLSYHRRE